VPISLAAGPEVIAIPGPTVMPPRVLEAMSRAMPDIYSGNLMPATDEVFDALPGLARTASQGVVTIGNGHAAWEMALTNTLSKGDKVLVLECGVFAQVWGDMARFDGLDVEVMYAEDGHAIDPDLVQQRLAADTERTIKAVLLSHVDTASSIRNDVAAIRRALDATDHPALLMADCIASLGCERYEMDEWGVDVTIAASQKGLMTPPGLSFVWPGRRAWEAHRTADLRTRYWDWTYRTQEGPHYLRFCGTQPVSHIFGLCEAIRMIHEEGLEARWARHAALADAVRAAVDAWSVPGGLRLHALNPSERGDEVTTIETGGIDPARIAQICREQCGVTLGVGLSKLAGRAFRIGHMGYVNVPMVMGTLGAVESALIALDAPIGGSGVAAAARSLGGALAR
jgi:alanine-glyoxylate transaminase / serine-glyoxylate transaminase / serine-pyruvate transaminase